jgi:uracil-DNA glycosylase
MRPLSAATRALQDLKTAEAGCTRCSLYLHATQVVPGEGPADAQLMFVGEEPGDAEDLRGVPFVGPAGRVLDRAIADAGLDRTRAFITNAVKHFKFERRGKRRLHRRPDAYETDRCRWWLDQERTIVEPLIVVALGATAARAVLGRSVMISRVRGEILADEDGDAVLVTVHPSYLLRIQGGEKKAEAYRRFVDDLRVCAEALKHFLPQQPLRGGSERAR